MGKVLASVLGCLVLVAVSGCQSSSAPASPGAVSFQTTVALPKVVSPSRELAGGGFGTEYAWQLVLTPGKGGRNVTLKVQQGDGEARMTGVRVDQETTSQWSTQRIDPHSTLVYGITLPGVVKVQFSGSGQTISGSASGEGTASGKFTVFWIQVPNDTDRPPQGTVRFTTTAGHTFTG